jgi:hypothetical protein
MEGGCGGECSEEGVARPLMAWLRTGAIRIWGNRVAPPDENRGSGSSRPAKKTLRGAGHFFGGEEKMQAKRTRRGHIRSLMRVSIDMSRGARLFMKKWGGAL